MRNADGFFAADDFQFDGQGLDAADAILDIRRRRMLADGDAGAGGVEQADRLVRQLARRDIAMRKAHRRFDAPRPACSTR